MPNGWFSPSMKHFALFGDAVAIGVAQARDAIRAVRRAPPARRMVLRSRSRTRFDAARRRIRPLQRARRHSAAPRSSADASRPVAKAFTLSPGAATGFCPVVQPRAVGIFSVGMAPCGFASGTYGVLPQAGAGAAPCNLRQNSAPAPISATMRAKTAEKFIAFPLYNARTLADVSTR